MLYAGEHNLQDANIKCLASACIESVHKTHLACGKDSGASSICAGSGAPSPLCCSLQSAGWLAGGIQLPYPQALPVSKRR